MRKFELDTRFSVGIILVVIGVYFMMEKLDIIWFKRMASLESLYAILLILFGVYLINPRRYQRNKTENEEK